MLKALLLATVLFVVFVGRSSACICAPHPNTFCETMDPPFPSPQTWIPHALIMGVKLADVYYGVDMLVVQSFHGAPQPGEVIRVWGDCGNLCRSYTNELAIGDTVIWGLRNCDGAGNNIFTCGATWEQLDHYMISVCGVYWLNYNNGLVTGPLTSTTEESMTTAQFADLAASCLGGTGVSEAVSEDPQWVRYEDGLPVLQLSTAVSPVQLTVCDVRGCAVLCRSWDGSALPLHGLLPGLYTAQVSTTDRRWASKVLVAY
ncbi:MAG: hypothetical protein ABI432_06475 [Flavobacteriales bacterium]